MNKKIYSCECGKEFTKPNSFNAHKSNCAIHFASIGKDFEKIKSFRGERLSESLIKRNEERRLRELEQWKSEQHTCERCGKIMTEKFGSGRFCSRACANTRTVTDLQRLKTSNTRTGNSLTLDEFIKTNPKKESIENISCPICNCTFTHTNGLRSHINRCKQKHNLPIYAKIGNQELDITREELLEYIKIHTSCEICGKTIEEVTRYKGKYAVKRLCVDHNHSNNKFRGLLCQACNRQLGWFEKYQTNIITYLNKDNK